MRENDGVHMLTDLEQVKLLAHPLRSRILTAFCGGEFTTKQVAENLGEKPTKLYHHVEMLEKAGLLRKTRTQQNRGTLEQYYEAIARSFQVDPQIFSGGSSDGSDEQDVRGMLRDIFEGTGKEMAQMFPDMAAVEAEEEAVLGHLIIGAEQEQIDELRRRIMSVADYIKELSETSEDEGGDQGEASRRFRLTLAFYPLDKLMGEKD